MEVGSLASDTAMMKKKYSVHQLANETTELIDLWSIVLTSQQIGEQRQLIQQGRRYMAQHGLVVGD
jgi:hypothetical protein